MMSDRMNAGTASDDYPFAAMQQQQQPPSTYVGFEHAGMVSGGGGQRGQMMYDNFDFAATAFGQFQQEAPPHHHHQMLALPPPSGAGGGLMAPPPSMPHGGMQLQMPPMPMSMHGHGGGDLYPSLGMVKREGGGTDAGRIGLNLGRRTYFSPGDMMAVDRMLMRSGRLGGVFGLGFGGGAHHHHAPPRCQAEGCKADLSGAKHYHRRHKVCEYHAKASLVAAGGKQQRFCQQCSRFHVLTEFDEAKRSCRKRLAEHNRRRRKPAAGGNGTAVSKDSSAPPSKKPNSGAVSSSYTADNNNNFSAARSTISSNTSAISCLQQQQQQQQQHDQISCKVARPTALTLGGMHLQAQADHHHHRHQEQQHFITSLLHNNNNNNHSHNILSCSSVCSSVLPAEAANGEASDQHNNDDGSNGGGNNNNMHLFEVDFM